MKATIYYIKAVIEYSKNRIQHSKLVDFVSIYTTPAMITLKDNKVFYGPGGLIKMIYGTSKPGPIRIVQILEKKEIGKTNYKL
jgi:hypothetical protein